jgi:hypothetical protein
MKILSIQFDHQNDIILLIESIQGCRAAHYDSDLCGSSHAYHFINSITDSKIYCLNIKNWDFNTKSRKMSVDE